ncbi:MAG TPA: cytochrome c biogenesis protein CcsA [Longimicrobiaceae bacterium]|nr:cytochrome c biogenesis protein CcsA [Longimicrobiaceae bacterium]
MIAWLHLTALLLYAAAAVLMWISFAREAGKLPAVASIVLAGALALHTAALVTFAVQWRELPLVGFGPSLSTLAYLVGLGTLIAATLGRARTVGLVLIPVPTVLLAVATTVGVHSTRETLPFRNTWFVLHVVFAFVGYVGLTVAFAAGLMYLLQFRQLKSKRFGAIFRFFPPLDTLDQLGRRGLLIGFPFLTLAMLVGWAWMTRFNGAVQARSTELVWGVLSWLVFVAALAARTGGGRRGHRGALASVIGFVLVVLIYVVLRVQATHGGAFL